MSCTVPYGYSLTVFCVMPWEGSGGLSLQLLIKTV